MSSQDEDEVHKWLRSRYHPMTNDGPMVKCIRFADIRKVKV